MGALTIPVPHARGIPRAARVMGGGVLRVRRCKRASAPRGGRRECVSRRQVIPHRRRQVARVSKRHKRSHVTRDKGNVGDKGNRLFLGIRPRHPISISPSDGRPCSFGRRHGNRGVSRNKRRKVRKVKARRITRRRLVMRQNVARRRRNGRTHRYRRSRATCLGRRGSCRGANQNGDKHRVSEHRPHSTRHANKCRRQISPQCTIHHTTQRRRRPHTCRCSCRRAYDRGGQEIHAPPRRPCRPIKGTRGKGRRRRSGVVNLTVRGFPRLRSNTLLLQAVRGSQSGNRVRRGNRCPNRLARNTPNVLMFRRGTGNSVCRGGGPRPVMRTLRLVHLSL